MLKSLVKSQSYVIRIWNDAMHKQEPSQWRFVLIDSMTETPIGFTKLDDLFGHLIEQIVQTEIALSHEILTLDGSKQSKNQ